MDKLPLPTFDGVSDPSAHVTSFNIAMRRVNLFDEEKDAGFCQLFVETLEGIALHWFTGLQENSVNSFHDLSTDFLKKYIMFTRQEATATDLWNLNHANGQSLRDCMENFKSVVSKVDVPDHIAVESLMNTLHIKCRMPSLDPTTSSIRRKTQERRRRKKRWENKRPPEPTTPVRNRVNILRAVNPTRRGVT